MNMHERLRARPVDDIPARSRRFSPAAKWVLAAVVLGAIILAAFFLFRGDGDEAAGGAAVSRDAGPGTAPRVTVLVPGSNPVTANVRVTGSIAATRDLPVGVQGQGGMVMSVLVKEGDFVREGQVLARIDRRVQVQQVEQLRAAVAQARADLKLAESELTRAEQLVDRGFISNADIDRRTATRDAAAAQVNIAQAQLEESQARLGQLDVRAPEGGLILTRAVEPGQVVGSGSAALFRIAQSGQMELRALVPEQDLSQVEVGQGAEIRISGSPTVYRGTVSLVDPVVDAQSRQGTARIVIRGDRKVRPGAFATATIETGSADRPVLPESAVLGDVGDSYVYTVNADDTVKRTPIEVGSVSSTGVVILSGLDGSERVVESAGAFLNEGDKIEPARAEDPA